MKRTAICITLLIILFTCPCIAETISGSDTKTSPVMTAGSAYANAIKLPVKRVFADEYTSFIIDADNTLYACGNVSSLGVEKYRQTSVYEKIMDNVICVSGSESHTLIVKTDGSLWACGDNTYGQLGNGTSESSETFIRIMEDVDTAIALHACSFVIKKDGSLWMWGEREYFLDEKEWRRWPEIGDILMPEYVTDNVKELALGLSFALVLKKDGVLYIQGNYPYHLMIDNQRISWFYEMQPVMEDVRSVAAENDYWLAVQSDGKLWHHGKYAPIGLGTGLPEFLMDGVQTVAVTDARSYGSAYALKDNGSLWAWGHNSGGQLGDGTGNEHEAPFQVLDNVTQIASGGYHTISMKRDGSVWAWGYNNLGQLGNGYSQYTLQPYRIMEDVAAIDDHDARLIHKTDGSIWTWGLLKNDAPSRMVAGDVQKYFSLGYIEGNEANGYTQVNQYFLKKDASVWACGKNDRGQLGDGTVFDRAEPVSVLGGVAALYVADSSYGLNYALTQEGDVYQWGSITYPNKDGSIGGNPDNSLQILSPAILPLENVIKVAAGFNNETMLAITSDGALWAWGSNDNGMVGNGKKAWQRQPAIIMTGVEDAYIDNGRGICIATKKDGSLYVWGGVISSNGEKKVLRKPNKILDDIMGYITNGECVLAQKNDGSLWAWGFFPSGAIFTQARKIMDDGYHLVPGVMNYVLSRDGSLWELNLQSRKPYAVPEKILDNVDAVSEGFAHYSKSTVLALTHDGGVWAWGANNMGSVGNGSLSGSQDTPIKIMDNGKAIKTLYDLSIAITQDGGLWIWGNWSPDPNYKKGLPLCILP